MDKKYYENKEYAQGQYVSKRNARNEEIETLTEEQHEVIQRLCAVRHDMHTNGVDEIFSAESNKCFNEWVGGVSAREGETINNMLQEVNLKLIKNLRDFDDCDNSATYDYEIEEDDYDTEDEYDDARTDAEEEARREISNIIEYNDKTIVEYLQAIDKEYGTEYAPTGMSRGNYIY